ncbi:hypothetical protein C8Q74DRAFT_1220231 [Fomes fomentarius]|nr:hypothetical protein C8Q74DRAFT_1220231 [Fomes fomentarius]
MHGKSERPPWFSSHPVQFFGQWTSTLMELVCHFPYAHPEHDPSPCYPEVYPMMHTLSIRYRGRLDPTPYIRAFPNPTHLDVDTGLELNDDMHKYRTSNIHSQRKVQHIGPAFQHAGWQELVQFNGPLVDLYALALDCRISHIKLGDHIEDMHLPLLSAVLADAQPIHLNIWIEGPINSLCSTLQTQGVSHLESLVVHCMIDGRTAHEDVASALSSLAASLAMLPRPLHHLHVVIRLYHLPDTHQSPPSQITIATAHIDVEQVVQDFVEKIPTLEDALVVYYDGVATAREASFMRPVSEPLVLPNPPLVLWRGCGGPVTASDARIGHLSSVSCQTQTLKAMPTVCIASLKPRMSSHGERTVLPKIAIPSRLAESTKYFG